jgi:hypothetical protein
MDRIDPATSGRPIHGQNENATPHQPTASVPDVASGEPAAGLSARDEGDDGDDGPSGAR